jgi:hypothetical protein
VVKRKKKFEKQTNATLEKREKRKDKSNTLTQHSTSNPRFYSHSEERESHLEQEQTSMVSHFIQGHHIVILHPNLNYWRTGSQR